MQMFIAGVVVGAIALSLIALLFPTHKHKWEARALTYMTKALKRDEEYLSKADVTEVLYGCSCGEIKTKELMGSWKMEDITGPSLKSKEDKELGSLRKMAGIPDEEIK